MNSDREYLAAKKMLADQSRRDSMQRRREKIAAEQLEQEIDGALEVIRAAGEVTPGSQEEVLLLVTMLLRKRSVSSTRRPDFLIGDEGE